MTAVAPTEASAEKAPLTTSQFLLRWCLLLGVGFVLIKFVWTDRMWDLFTLLFGPDHQQDDFRVLAFKIELTRFFPGFALMGVLSAALLDRGYRLGWGLILLATGLALLMEAFRLWQWHASIDTSTLVGFLKSRLGYGPEYAARRLLRLTAIGTACLFLGAATYLYVLTALGRLARRVWRWHVRTSRWGRPGEETLG